MKKLKDYISDNLQHIAIYDETSDQKGFCAVSIDDPTKLVCKNSLELLKNDLCTANSEFTNTSVCRENWNAWKSIDVQKQNTSLLHLNLIFGLIQVTQAIVMFILGSVLEFNMDIMGHFYDYKVDPPVLDPQTIFTMTNIGVIVAAYLFISGLVHLLVAIPMKKTYLEKIQRKQNPFRWWEYSISASIMLVIIAILNGINDVFILMSVFVFSFITNMMGIAMEEWNYKRHKVSWFTFTIGVVAFVIPWLIIIGYVIARYLMGVEIPVFVWLILIIEFLLEWGFAMIMIWYFRKWKNFENYEFTETAYTILSLVAKSFLAWMIFFNFYS